MDGTVKLTLHDFVSVWGEGDGVGPPLVPVEKLKLAGNVETQAEEMGLAPVPATATVAVKSPLPAGAVTLCTKETAAPPAVAVRPWVVGE